MRRCTGRRMRHPPAAVVDRVEQAPLVVLEGFHEPACGAPHAVTRVAGSPSARLAGVRDCREDAVQSGCVVLSPSMLVSCERGGKASSQRDDRGRYSRRHNPRPSRIAAMPNRRRCRSAERETGGFRGYERICGRYAKRELTRRDSKDGDFSVLKSRSVQTPYDDGRVTRRAGSAGDAAWSESRDDSTDVVGRTRASSG